MSIERSGPIIGIKKLVQMEEALGSVQELIVPGIWYVNGLRTNTGSLKEARRIAEQHQIETEEFKALNERINERARRKAYRFDIDKRLEQVLK